MIDLSGIPTQIVGLEGEHADHLTIITAQSHNLIYYLSS